MNTPVNTSANATGSLALYEQIYLLSVQNHNGKPHDYTTLLRQHYAIAGASIMEMVSSGFLRLDEDQRCLPASDAPPQDATLAAAFERIRKSKKPHNAKYWVQMIHAHVAPHGKALRNLVEKGVIRLDRGTKWKIFPVKRYRVERPDVKDAIVHRLEALLQTETTTAETNHDERARDTILLGLVRSAELTRYVFPGRYAADAAKLDHDIAEVLRRKPVPNPTDEALEEEEEKERAMEALEMSLDALETLAYALDAVADAVDASADAGGDGGGGDGSD